MLLYKWLLFSLLFRGHKLAQHQLKCGKRATYHTALCPFDGVELLVPEDAVVVVVGAETEGVPADGRSIGVGTTVEFALGVGISS